MTRLLFALLLLLSSTQAQASLHADVQAALRGILAFPENVEQTRFLKRMDTVLVDQMVQALSLYPASFQQRVIQSLLSAQGVVAFSFQVPLFRAPRMTEATNHVNVSLNQRPRLIYRKDLSALPSFRISLFHEFRHLLRFTLDTDSDELAIRYATEQVSRRLGIYREELWAFAGSYDLIRALNLSVSEFERLFPTDTRRVPQIFYSTNDIPILPPDQARLYTEAWNKIDNKSFAKDLAYAQTLPRHMYIKHKIRATSDYRVYQMIRTYAFNPLARGYFKFIDSRKACMRMWPRKTEDLK